MASIEWKDPWWPVPIIDGSPWAQSQLEKEVTRAHPLYGRGGKVVGRRYDCDDILVLLDDGTYVNVHLVWNQTAEPHPEMFPSWYSYGTLESFIGAMNDDAEEFGQ